jgi:stage II sporulation protein D
VLHGAGHGHGVGLCQHGAIGMAAAGTTYGPILHHYYAGSKLIRLW